MKFRVYRYNPDQDQTPPMQDYDIALDPHDRMLLDALIELKAYDDTLAFRRSCREGVCCFFFFNDTATTEISTLSLHDALPISLSFDDTAATEIYTLSLHDALPISN